MDFLAENLWIVWLAIAGIMLVVELNTTALVSIWFVIGAVACAVVSFFFDSIALQIVLFVVISLFCLFLFRILYKEKIMSKKDKDVEYSPVGKRAVVVKDVSFLGGMVKLDDVYWKAVCKQGTEYSVGTFVTVVAAEGTTLEIEG